MTSLEGWSSTIELRPQQPHDTLTPNAAADTGSVPSPGPITVISTARDIARSAASPEQASHCVLDGTIAIVDRDVQSRACIAGSAAGHGD